MKTIVDETLVHEFQHLAAKAKALAPEEVHTIARVACRGAYVEGERSRVERVLRAYIARRSAGTMCRIRDVETELS